jgi:hypothetical protein
VCALLGTGNPTQAGDGGVSFKGVGMRKVEWGRKVVKWSL